MVGEVKSVIWIGISPLQMFCVPDMVPAVIGFSIMVRDAVAIHPEAKVTSTLILSLLLSVEILVVLEGPFCMILIPFCKNL